LAGLPSIAIRPKENAIDFLLICGLFFGIPTWYMIWASGWRQLTDLYEAGSLDGLISEGSYRLVRCRSKYTTVVVALEIYPSGLWLKVPFPLKLFVSSVLIPWEKIRLGQTRPLFGRGVSVEIADWPCHMELGGNAGKAVRGKLEATWPHD